MMLAAGVLFVFAVVGPGSGALVDRPLSLTAVGVLLVGASACRWVDAEVLQRVGVWFVVPVGATGLVLLLNAATRDTSAGAQVFLCFPVLWASSQLRRRAAGVLCVLTIAGNTVIVLRLEPVSVALPDVVFVGLVLFAMTEVLGRAGDRQESLVLALQAQAGLDTLTGLVTRRVLDQAVTQALVTSGNADGTALLLIDVDRFKTINDEHGHPVGDDALVHLATLLAAQVRSTDAVVGRLGGDEIAIMLPGCTAAVAAARAEELVTAVRESPLRMSDGRLLALSVSIGVAHARPHGAGLQELYVSADAALYDAKRRGRDQVAFAGSRD